MFWRMLILSIVQTTFCAAFSGITLAVRVNTSSTIALCWVLFSTTCVAIGFFTVTWHVAFTPLPSCAVAVRVTSPAFKALNLPLPKSWRMSVLSIVQTTFCAAFSGITLAVRVNTSSTIALCWVLFSSTCVAIGFFTVTWHVAFTSLPSCAVAVRVTSPAFKALNLPPPMFWRMLFLSIVQTTFCAAFSGITWVVRVNTSSTIAWCCVSFSTTCVALGISGFFSFTTTRHVAFIPLPSCEVAVMVTSPAFKALNWPFPTMSRIPGWLKCHVTFWSASLGKTLATRLKTSSTVTLRRVASSTTCVAFGVSGWEGCSGVGGTTGLVGLSGVGLLFPFTTIICARGESFVQISRRLPFSSISMCIS